MKTRSLSLLSLLLALLFFASSCTFLPLPPQTPEMPGAVNLDAIPPYTDKPYVTIEGDPNFSEEARAGRTSYETYTPLDDLGRTVAAEACIGRDLMPTEDEERESLQGIEPTGWIQKQYDFVGGGSLYNRCHLIGWQLTAENRNERNLATGTRYINIQGMLPFENMVADYIKETNNHVLYRATMIYEGDNLLANGIHLEAWSVEDEGDGICFNVYLYNVQPGVEIDYKTGASRAAGAPPDPTDDDGRVADYVLNTGNKKIHLPTCSSVSQISEKNKKEYRGTMQDLLAEGYTRCGSCNP